MNRLAKRQKVNKLFYNKWPYKVECLVVGASRIVRQGNREVIDWCDGVSKKMDYWNNGRNVDKVKLRAFTIAVVQFLDRKEEIQIRTEGARFSLFCKDTAIFDNIIKCLQPWLWAVYEPNSKEELEFLVTNDNKRVLCDSIPYDKYPYKVILRQAPSNVRQQFSGWSKNYGEDKIKISPQTVRWLDGHYTYKQDPFFYVSDPHMLTMTRLFLGGNVRRVVEYVPREAVE